MTVTDLSVPPTARRHWYRIHIEECVLCGRTTEDRERVYGQRPEDDSKRYVYRQTACQGHFL